MDDSSIPQVEEKKITGHIYVITNTVNGKQYVGQTIGTVEARWKRHLYVASYNTDKPIYRAIRKYGEPAFIVEEIDRADSLDHLNELEEVYIASFNTISPNGYNLNSGGKNHRPSPETLKKMSEAHRGKVASKETRIKHSESMTAIWQSKDKRANLLSGIRANAYKISNAKIGNKNRLGHTHSVETKDKISKSLIGLKHSEETCIKMSTSIKAWWDKNKGLKRSDATRAKMSISHIGHKHSDETKFKIGRARIGIKQSEETCAKKSASLRATFKARKNTG